MAVASEGVTRHDPDHSIVVIGAGYAGVTAANRIRGSLTPAERQRVRIVMINRSGEFVERVRLHEVAAGTIPTAAFPLRDILHPDVEVIVGDVAAIDPDRKLLDVMTDERSAGRALRHADLRRRQSGGARCAGRAGARLPVEQSRRRPGGP